MYLNNVFKWVKRFLLVFDIKYWTKELFRGILVVDKWIDCLN